MHHQDNLGVTGGALVSQKPYVSAGRLFHGKTWFMLGFCLTEVYLFKLFKSSIK